MLGLDNSNIQHPDDSNIFIWNEKLATLDRNWETQLNLDNSQVAPNSENITFDENEKTKNKNEDNNFIFDVKTNELIFNKKQTQNVQKDFQKWKRNEQEKKETDILMENIRLSSFKKSRNTSGALESSLRTGDSSKIKSTKDNSHQESEKQSGYMGEAMRNKGDSAQSLEEELRSGRKRMSLQREMRPVENRYRAGSGELEIQWMNIIRENERLKIKNEQLKDLAKKLKNKNRDRKEHIKELNGALEEALNVNDVLEERLMEMEKQKKGRDMYVKGLEQKIKRLESIGGRRKKNKAQSMGQEKFPKKLREENNQENVEELGAKEEGLVNKLIRSANKIEDFAKEKLKQYEEHCFIFQLKRNNQTGYLESKLLNKTVYSQKMKNNMLSTLLDKIFRTSNPESFLKVMFYAPPSHLFLPKEMVDEVFDSDFSEYLENPEDEEEIDDYDHGGIDMKYSSKVKLDMRYNSSKYSPYQSKGVTPKKGRLILFLQKEFRINKKKEEADPIQDLKIMK